MAPLHQRLGERAKPTQNWDDLYRLYERFHQTRAQWIFRGHADEKWHLETTLERAVYRYGIDKAEPDEADKERVLANGLPSSGAHPALVSIGRLEGGLLRQFKRRCYHYIRNTPEPQNHVEWLALMRHYGAPARLLDCTYSFFVAVYNAIESGLSHNAVWAIDSDWLKKPFAELVRKSRNIRLIDCWERDNDITKPQTFDALFLRRSPIAVVGYRSS